MTEPLKQDQRVIADTSIDGIYNDGTAYVIPIVIGEEGKDFWRYPLTDEMVERLAEVAYEANIQSWMTLYGVDSLIFPPLPWEESYEEIREPVRAEIRAIFAELMDGAE